MADSIEMGLKNWMAKKVISERILNGIFESFLIVG